MNAEQKRYWLSHCDGFRVMSPEGRVGEVVAPLLGADRDEPRAVIVRSGLFRTRLATVPVDQIVEVDPRRGRLIIGPTPA